MKNGICFFFGSEPILNGGLHDVVKVTFPRRLIVRVSVLEVINNRGYEVIVATVFEDIRAD
jgi:hypothetical protein